ncbi:hypothetical protein OEZ86_010199 [Tetradesmus obliquus]|nr:hypothetical protein OEZ86_010199 [Tetradesmus obliquus]
MSLDDSVGLDGGQPHHPARYKGLSWDEKYHVWRRHVGRYEDEGEAAKAYDKAAVYLYGAGAVTNFGLAACQEDPTEVSDFIVQAKANSHLKMPGWRRQQHCQ